MPAAGQAAVAGGDNQSLMRFACFSRRLRHRAPLAAIVAWGALLAGCSTHQVGAISVTALATARDFKEYTVYWAGLEVDGVHLTEADSPTLFNLYTRVGFIVYYGNCEGRGPLRDGGCTLPLKITTNIYESHSDASFGPQHWIEIHGVPAVVYGGGDNLEIYTDHQDIDIVADSPARAMAAAVALEPSTARRPRTGRRFRSPSTRPTRRRRRWPERPVRAASPARRPPSRLRPSSSRPRPDGWRRNVAAAARAERRVSGGRRSLGDRPESRTGTRSSPP